MFLTPVYADTIPQTEPQTPPEAQNGPYSDVNPLTRLSELSEKYGVSQAISERIIQCESGGVAEAKNINYIDGIPWSEDVGYWQINNYFHEESLALLGWDIYNPEDNLEAGFFLLSTQGLQPWDASSFCWR